MNPSEIQRDMKYRKKPVVIEAEQWFEGKEVDGVLTHQCTYRMCPICQGVDEPISYIPTLEGPLYVTEGDFIITGVKGEKYPCKPDIFEMTYEPL